MLGGQMSGQARHEEMHEGVPGADHDGMHEMRGGGHPGMHAGMNVFGGRVQHGEAAVTLPDGSTATVRVQAGEVTAVDDSSITVKSPDGVEQSWPTSGSTKVDKAHSAAALADINVGDHVVVSGKVSAGSVSADRIHLMPAESGAEHTGPQGEPTSGTDD